MSDAPYPDWDDVDFVQVDRWRIQRMLSLNDDGVSTFILVVVGNEDDKVSFVLPPDGALRFVSDVLAVVSAQSELDE